LLEAGASISQVGEICTEAFEPAKALMVRLRAEERDPACEYPENEPN
jgi:hypothetical protein